MKSSANLTNLLLKNYVIISCVTAGKMYPLRTRLFIWKRNEISGSFGIYLDKIIYVSLNIMQFRMTECLLKTRSSCLIISTDEPYMTHFYGLSFIPHIYSNTGVWIHIDIIGSFSVFLKIYHFSVLFIVISVLI